MTTAATTSSMPEPLPSDSQTADVKTPIASLDKHGKAKTGLKQEFEHYKEQQKAKRSEKQDDDDLQEEQQEVEEESVVQDDPAENRLDFSAWNWWNNARVMVGESKIARITGKGLIAVYAAGTCLRNLADAVSVPYHYRRYSQDRYSVYLSDLGNDEHGQPIPTLRILIYLPTKGRTTAVPGTVEAGEQMGKAQKRGVMVHLAGGGFTM